MQPDSGVRGAEGGPASFSRRFLFQSLVLLVILITLVPLVDNDAFSIPDEGLYAAQASQLLDGSWGSVRPTAGLDEDGAWDPVVGAIVVDAEHIPYARRPLYPVALTPFYGLGGIAGGMVLSVLGTWVAATVSGLIARRLDRRAAFMTLWLVGLGSPLFFDSYVLVGHTWAAGFAAVVTLAVIHLLRLREPGSPGEAEPPKPTEWIWAVTAVAGTVGLVLVRSEGLVLAGSLGAACCVAAISASGRRLRLKWDYLGIGAGLLMVGALTYVLNDVWSRAITSGDRFYSPVNGRNSDIVNSVWVSLVRPWYPDNTHASAAMTLVLLAAIVAPLLMRPRRTRVLALGLALLGGGAAIFQALQAPSLVSGLLPTVPWIIVGWLSLGRDQFRAPTTRLLIGTSLIATVAISATAYGQGGAAEWGGRFYHVLIPVLGPVAAAGLLAAKDRCSPAEWRVAAISLLAGTIAVASIGIRANRAERDINSRLESFIEASASQVDSHVVVLSLLSAAGTSRVLWRVNETGHATLLNVPGIRWLPLLLDRLPADITQVALVTSLSYPSLVEKVVRNTTNGDWSVTPANKSDDDPSFVYEIDRN